MLYKIKTYLNVETICSCYNCNILYIVVHLHIKCKTIAKHLTLLFNIVSKMVMIKDILELVA